MLPECIDLESVFCEEEEIWWFEEFSQNSTKDRLKEAIFWHETDWNKSLEDTKITWPRMKNFEV